MRVRPPRGARCSSLPVWALEMSPSGSCSAASCAAPNWARRCCRSASPYPFSPATRCPRLPTHLTRSSSCSRSRARRRTPSAGRSASRSAWSCSRWWRRTGRTCTPTRAVAGTTRSPRSTSAGRPGSRSPQRCWSTTCSPSLSRSPRGCRTQPRPSPRFQAMRPPQRASSCSSSLPSTCGVCGSRERSSRYRPTGSCSASSLWRCTARCALPRAPFQTSRAPTSSSSPLRATAVRSPRPR